VEKKFNLRKPGRWRANPTSRAKERNSPSVCANVAAKPSEPQSAKRKSDLLKDQTQTPSFLFI